MYALNSRDRNDGLVGLQDACHYLAAFTVGWIDRFRTMPTLTPAVAPIPPAGSVETTNEVWNAYLAHRAAEKYTVVLRTIVFMAVLATCLVFPVDDVSAITFSVAISLWGTASLLRFTMFGKKHVESLVTGGFTAGMLGIIAV